MLSLYYTILVMRVAHPEPMLLCDVHAKLYAAVNCVPDQHAIETRSYHEDARLGLAMPNVTIPSACKFFYEERAFADYFMVLLIVDGKYVSLQKTFERKFVDMEDRPLVKAKRGVPLIAS